MVSNTRVWQVMVKPRPPCGGGGGFAIMTTADDSDELERTAGVDGGRAAVEPAAGCRNGANVVVS